MDQVGQLFGGISQQCNIHKKLGLLFASPISSDPNPFNCATCVARRYKDMIPFISIQEILTSDQDALPIQNWPPGIHDDDIQFLINKQSDSIKYKLSQMIMDFYEKLSDQVNIAINESKKQQLNQLDIHFGTEDLIDQYNKLFNRKELVRIFEHFNEQSHEEFKKLLDSMSATSEKDLKTLQQLINEKKEEEFKFKVFQDDSIKALSKKFNSILNDLSLSLFVSDEEDQGTQQYHFNLINQELVEKIEEESQILKSLNLKSNIAEENELILLTESNIKCIQWLKSITYVKKNGQKCEGYCYNKNQIKEGSIVNFELIFMKNKSFENFEFGFLESDKNVQDGTALVYQYFWERVKQIKNQKKIKDPDALRFSFSVNMRKKMLKARSPFLEGGLTQQIKDFKPNLEYRILFYLQKHCLDFFICFYSSYDSKEQSNNEISRNIVNS